MLSKVKLAMRISATTTAFDDELKSLIAAAKLDLGIAGVRHDEYDPLMTRAIITYCRCNFGSPSDYDKLLQSYQMQKAQLMVATGYTDFGDDQVTPGNDWGL